MFSRVTGAAKRMLPPAVRVTLRRIRNRITALRDQPEPPSRPEPAGPMDDALYERLYERHARELPPETSIGGGPYDLIGRMELGALRMAGLKTTSTLVDFGCGTGRLAVHAVPFLTAGRYVGTDISESMLAQARARISTIGETTCAVELVKQTSEVFDLRDASADFICAFSVFTHMEHEDTYRYLRDALRVVRPGGRLVLSCLPMNLPNARAVFLASASVPFAQRWKQVRNVTTSTEMMEAVATLAGWTAVEWYPGDVPTIPLPPDNALHALGQSILVLEALAAR